MVHKVEEEDTWVDHSRSHSTCAMQNHLSRTTTESHTRTLPFCYWNASLKLAHCRKFSSDLVSHDLAGLALRPSALLPKWMVCS
jgi:hypothetical protein